MKELQEHAVAYINSDTNERGYLQAGGTQDMQSFLSGVARDIEDPETRLSVFQRSHLRAIARAKDADERSDLRKRNDLIHALGDGSDFTAFQDFAGISTLSLSSAARTTATSTIPFTTIFTGTHVSSIPISLMEGRGANRGNRLMRLADAELIPGGLLPASRSNRKIRKRTREAA